MPVNTTDTIPVDVKGKTSLPLQNFFIVLKQNGFLVTPEQIIDATRVISEYSHQVQNENQLQYFLSPIFARNEEEQLQFEELFKSSFGVGQLTIPVNEAQEKNYHIKKHWWKYLAAIIALAFTIWILTKENKPPVFRTTLYLSDKDESIKSEEGRRQFQVNVKDSLHVRVFTTMDSANQNVRLETEYNYGDDNELYNDSSHVYHKQGTYLLQAYVRVFLNDQIQYTDTLKQNVLVCSNKNIITIDKNFSSDSIAIGERVSLSTNVTGNQPDSIRWYTDVDQWVYAKTFDTTYSTEGRQTIEVAAIFDSLNGPCTIMNDVSFLVYDPDKPKLAFAIQQSANALPLASEFKVRPFWFYLSGGLGLFAFIMTVAAAMRFGRKKKEDQTNQEKKEQEIQQLLQSFSGKKTPAELPLQNKNYLPIPEAELNEAAIQMRRRINTEASYLEINKTIEKSIDNLGYFDPVYVPRLQQSEYLILIDASHNNNQQVKLFDYLIDVLRKQNVFIEKYYYRYEPKFCFNSLEPDGITLEKLSEKYENHILLIFGNAYQLLYQYYPVFDHDYLQLLNRWKKKAIITPVSFLDWGNKETRALLPQIPVVPVDVEGQLELMEILFAHEYDIIAGLKQFEKSFYKVDPIDFENVTELEAYCNLAPWSRVTENGKQVNILFQWIAALSIYPKIKWETTVSIGKTILDRYGKGEELNFSNLLRIARIKWMKDGQFPDYTRLDLLKQLTVENEIAARETILSLLKEIPETEMNEKHFAYEEKEIQRITNEFILYAYDPFKYEAYKHSREIFEKLWKDRRITDGPSKVYLKNAGSEWNTPVNKVSEEGSITKNVSLENYFKKEDESDKKQNLTIVKAFAGLLLLSIIALLFFIVLNFLNTNKFSAFTYKPVLIKDISFNLYNNTTVPPEEINMSIDTFSTDRNWDKLIKVPVAIKDSSHSISFYVSGETIMRTSMQIGFDSYDVEVTDSVTPSPSKLAWILAPLACKKVAEMIRSLINTIDTGIQVKDSIVSGRNSAADCINKISFGSSYDAAFKEKLLESFKKNGFNLQVITSPPSPIGYNEILVYFDEKIQIAKPQIYIQYNLKNNSSKAAQLQNCINQTVFNAPGIQFIGNLNRNFIRNEIRYYNDSFVDSIAILLNCLKSIFPDKTFLPVKINNTNKPAVAEIWIHDEILKGGPEYLFRSMTEALSIPADMVYRLDLSNQKYSYADIIRFNNLKEINIKGTGATASEISQLEEYMRKKGGKVIRDAEKTTTILKCGTEISLGMSFGKLTVFVRDPKGTVYGIAYVGTNRGFSEDAYYSENNKRGFSIGKLERTSRLNSSIRLIRIENVNVENRITGDVFLTGIGVIDEGMEIFMYETSVNAINARLNQGIITSIQYSNAGNQNQSYSSGIEKEFRSDIKLSAGSIGNVVKDIDSKALGIMIKFDGKETIFIPIQRILDEFDVELLMPAKGN